MVFRRRNQEEIRKYITKITKLSNIFLLISIFIFSVGLVSVFKISNSGNNYLSISAYAIDSPDSDENSNKLFLVILYVIFLISLLVNVYFFLYFRRVLNTLSDSEERVEKGVDSLRERKNEEIKEVVVTRNILLDKLSSKKS